MPSERSEHQREPAWPEVPPAWPEMPPPSSFTPTVRSFVEGTPPQSPDATATMAGPLPGAAPRQPGPASGEFGGPGAAPVFPVQDGFGGGDHTGGPRRSGAPEGFASRESFGAPEGFGGPEGRGGPERFGGREGFEGAAQAGGPASFDGPASAYGTPQAPAGPDRGQWQGRPGPNGGAFPGGPSGPEGQDRPQPSSPFTPSVRSFAESAPPASAAPPPPPGQPEDPYRPFVTAGQISGPKTPPAHRQQELWNTVFGENYQAIDEYEDDEPGRPVWLYALVASVVAALVGVLVWAFVAGPLSSGDTAVAATPAKPSPAESAATAKPQAQIPRLPVFKGKASPVNGVLTDTAGRITLPRLGGPWQADADPAQIKATYGFTSRQHVPGDTTADGNQGSAQVMSGQLSQSLAAKYTTPGNLGPVVNAVMYRARQTQFPKGNKIAKIGQQRLARNGLTGLVTAYKVAAGGTTTTVVIAAVNTGADLPTIVYMTVPQSKSELLPDINTIFRSIKPIR
ncbi:hypothetical protein GCM10010116_07980 [Microbispora rosea subsp. aerata]|nr:hypothetical protein [Microbispora rosea]GGO04044.1 hypothetical protein GCM10010116_07980 [Microbispora rosea subsp. aerata]